MCHIVHVPSILSSPSLWVCRTCWLPSPLISICRYVHQWHTPNYKSKKKISESFSFGALMQNPLDVHVRTSHITVDPLTTQKCMNKRLDVVAEIPENGGKLFFIQEADSMQQPAKVGSAPPLYWICNTQDRDTAIRNLYVALSDVSHTNHTLHVHTCYCDPTTTDPKETTSSPPTSRPKSKTRQWPKLSPEKRLQRQRLGHHKAPQREQGPAEQGPQRKLGPAEKGLPREYDWY